MEKEVSRQLEIIKENVIDLVSEEELIEKIETSLREKRALRVKIGFDPTAKDLHLGHMVLLRKLRKLQDLGHYIYFIVGDFTAQIGDPSGKKELRPVLERHQIEENAKTYTEQAFKILDRHKTKIIFNSEWYKEMKLSDFLPLLSQYTVARMLERDDFSQRMEMKKPLSILEFIYPLIQGFDSVKISADIEFGGSDQKFNLIVGRHLQEVFHQPPQVIVTMPLLVGLDGKDKMSKSLGNYIGITEAPTSMFGKIMSISDELMWDYFRLLTDCDLEEVRKMHPKEAKLLLAEMITSFFYSSFIGKEEREKFERVFSQREIPEDIPVYKVDTPQVNLIDVLYKIQMVSSRNEARRLLTQGGITCRDVPIYQQTMEVPSEGVVLKIGKRRFLKIIPVLSEKN